MQPVEIEDVAPDAPLLAERSSRYEKAYARIMAMKPGERFRTKLTTKIEAKTVRITLKAFANKRNIPITTCLKNNELEITRLDDVAKETAQ